MGIPRLTSHLGPYFETRTVGCTKAGCSSVKDSKFSNIVVDGPSLAYHVYFTLLSRSEASSAIDALPSYRAIAGAVTAYLDELCKCNIRVQVLPQIFELEHE